MAEPNEVEEKQEKKGGMMVPLLALNLLAVIGIGVYLVFFGGGNQNAAAQAGMEKVDAYAEAKGAETDAMGPLVEFESFLVNLDEPGANRYLKAVVQLELDSPESADEVRTRMVQMRDIIITYLSSLNYSQTQGVVNKEIIRTSLIKKISAQVSKGKAKNLFFTEFVIQ